MGIGFCPSNARICNLHFSDECFIVSLIPKKLTSLAPPTIRVPAIPLREDLPPDEVEPASPSLDDLAVPSDPHIPIEVAEREQISSQPTISSGNNPTFSVSHTSEPLPGCSHWNDEYLNPSSPVELEQIPLQYLPEQSSSVGNRSGRGKRLFKNIGELSRSEITPRKRKLIGIVKKKNDHLRQLKNLCQERANTIKDLFDIDRSAVVEKIFAKMTTSGAKLMLSQIRCCRRSARGRRWTIDEKVLCLALFKRSPKCYALLRKFLTLPCRRTLTALLEKVPFRVGINEHLFRHIATCLKSRKPGEKTCVLFFDEMAIREQISFDWSEDRFIGFEDLGNNVATAGKPANHALVFMAQCVWEDSS